MNETTLDRSAAPDSGVKVQDTSPASFESFEDTHYAVPAELKEFPNWVVWRYEKRGEETTKPLYDAKTGQYAKSSDSTTWATFAQVKAVESRYDGIGFVIHGTPLVGIDFDGVVHNNEPEHFVLALLKLLGNPYCEISPSGNGLRVFVYGTLAGTVGRKFLGKDKDGKKYGAEIYSGTEGGRYLTVTGNRYSGEK